MSHTDFTQIDTWVFDLDHTLYPPGVPLFAQIEERMRQFISRALQVPVAQAEEMRKDYWRTYGTSLAGLMAEHGLEPDPFLQDVHRIDFSVVPRAPRLAAQIEALPGRCIVFTNGTDTYAEEVLAARGLSGLFDGVYGLHQAGYTPKPQPEAFTRVFAAAEVRPQSAVMFEDDPRNLAVPATLGLRTVLVAPEPADHPHIHHHTPDLEPFLDQVLRDISSLSAAPGAD